MSLPVVIAADTAVKALDKRADRKANARKNRTVDERDNDLRNKKQNRKIVLGVLGAATVAYLGNALYNKIKRDQATNRLGTDTPEGKAAYMAERFYAAFIPSGKEWLNDNIGDGSDEEALYQLAREMGEMGITLADIAKQYNALHPNRDFVKDLQDINAAELAKFNSELAAKRSTATATSLGLTQYGYAKAGTRVELFRSVKAGLFYGENGVNELTEIAGGTFIGTFTGFTTTEFTKFKSKLNGKEYEYWARTEDVDINTVYDNTKNKTAAQINEIMNNY